MDNNKPLTAEEQKIEEMVADLTARAEAGDMSAMLALALVDTVSHQAVWAECIGKTRRRRVTGMELRDMGMLQPVTEAKIDINAPLLEPDFELTGLGKYFGNSEKGVLVQVIPDEPTHYIHEAPRGLQ